LRDFRNERVDLRGHDEIESLVRKLQRGRIANLHVNSVGESFLCDASLGRINRLTALVDRNDPASRRYFSGQFAREVAGTATHI
jgi:hypothetical protein